MKRFSLLLIAMLVIGSMMLSSCKPAATETAVEEPAAAEEVAEEAEVVEEEIADADADKFGGTLYLAEAGLVNFDTPFINDDASFHVASLVHTFLFRSIDGETVPELASSWDFEEDGKVVIFHLNEGRYFQDGNDVFAEGEAREIVADDVVYSIDRYVNIEGGMGTSDFLSTYESVEAVDDYTVKLTLNSPNALLLVSGRGMSSVAILPQEAVEQLGENWALNPIGGGPFEFVEYVPDDHATLTKNEDYYIEPYLESVVFKVIPEQSVQTISLEAGEIHVTSLDPEEFERFNGDETYKIYSVQCPFSYNIQFNLNVELMQDINVREAMAHAIDGRGIMQNQYGDMWVEGCGTAGPGIPGYDPDLCEKYFAYDPAKTDELMAASGWEKNADGVWEKDGQTFSFQLEIWNLDPAPDIAAAAVTMLQSAGFDVELLNVEFGTWIEDALGGNSKDSMMWSGFCGEGGLNSYWGGDGLAPVVGAYNDEEVFELLASANQIVVPEEREAVLMEATDKIFASYPDIPFGFATTFEITRAEVQDYRRTDWWINLVTIENNVWLAK